MALSMDSTSSELEVVSEFKNRKRIIIRLAIVVGVVVSVAIILGFLGVASNAIAALIVTVVSMSALVVNLKVWRCPSCKGHLGKLYLGLQEPKHCPNCGVKLVEQ